MEKEILSLFLSNKKLKFNEIEKLLSVRSNKLDYHLKKLINKKVLEKNKDLYQLTDSSEYLIPYISDKKSVLPVLLILIGDKKGAFLYKRIKRPYENMLSLPGGRIVLGEKIPEAASRIMKEKHNINAKFNKVNSVSLEFVKKKNKTLHSFLLIFVSAKTRDKIKLTNLPENKLKIIPSDYKLIIKDCDKKILIKQINS